MFSSAQLLLVLTLVPLAAGVLIAALGARLPRPAAFGIAVAAVVIAFVAALLAAYTSLNGLPQLVTLITFGNVGLINRLDGWSVYLIVGMTALVGPVLIWMTYPRGMAEPTSTQANRPMGLSLVALSLALSAVLLDNILLIGLCWSGVGFVAWLMARPVIVPEDTEEWIDLPLLTAGPLLFVLVMIFPMVSGKTTSMIDMSGRDLTNVVTSLLIIVVLAFATGIYPFTTWVRRVSQGIMTEAVGVQLLLLLPIAVTLLGRLVVLFAPDDKWPPLLIGPATISLNVIPLMLGLLTVIVVGILLLVESDLLALTTLLSVLLIGWCFVAVGTGDSHSLLALPLLLTAYAIAIGSLMVVWSSLEWSGRELTIMSLPGLAQDLPLHFAVFAAASLTAVGVPLFAAFSGMAAVDQGLLHLGGTAALAGALIWVGNGLALFGVVRQLARAMRHPAERATDVMPISPRESLALFVPAALLLLGAIAPEILLVGKTVVQGPASTAASALLPSATTVPDLTTTAIGFNLDGTLWLPGLCWVLVIIGGGVAVLSAGLIGPTAERTPVFVGGEPLDGADQDDAFLSWNDLVTLARGPWVLPGPKPWRHDVGLAEEWLIEEDDDDDEIDGDTSDVFVEAEEDVEFDELAEDAEDTVEPADDSPEVRKPADRTEDKGGNRG